VVERGNFGWSKYNALQSELRVGNFHGLTATASYTWSHTLDNASEIFSTVAGGNTLSFAQNPFDVNRAEAANSGIDFPNVFGLAFVYEVPFAKEQHGFLGHVIGGWQLNTTYRYSTGQPYTVAQFRHSSFCDPTSVLSGTYDACRPILGDVSAPLNSAGIYCDGTVATCLATADPVDPLNNTALPFGSLAALDGCIGSDSTGGDCAATPLSSAHWIVNDDTAAAVLGSPFKGAGRNLLRGQPISTVNLGVFKNIKIGERVTLQFQAQAFNLLNTQYRGAPDPVIDDVTLGPPPAFNSTAYNFNGGGNNLEGGGNSSANLTYDGIGRRRLLFGLKLLF
jgi:hypothetical protein